MAGFLPDTILWGCSFPWLGLQTVTHVLCVTVQPLFPCIIPCLWGLCNPSTFPLATGAPVGPLLSANQPKPNFGGQQVFLVCGTLRDIDCLSPRLSKPINPWIWKASTPGWSSRPSTGCQEAKGAPSPRQAQGLGAGAAGPQLLSEVVPSAWSCIFWPQ